MERVIENTEKISGDYSQRWIDDDNLGGQCLFNSYKYAAGFDDKFISDLYTNTEYITKKESSRKIYAEVGKSHGGQISCWFAVSCAATSKGASNSISAAGSINRSWGSAYLSIFFGSPDSCTYDFDYLTSLGSTSRHDNVAIVSIPYARKHGYMVGDTLTLTIENTQ